MKGISKECKHFIKLCKMSQKALKKYLVNWLQTIGYKPAVSDGFIYAEGSLPVCVTAHMDTVHAELPKNFEVTKDNGGYETISATQGIGGDDRCGIYMIQAIVNDGYHPTILFCEDEEIGGVGSDKFCLSEHIGKLKGMKFFIELDRANDKDLVFYDDDNNKFHDFCEKTTGYKTSYGTFSDISNLCPEVKVSGVNISCGYYNAHHLNEYVVIKEMLDSIRAAEKLLDKVDTVEQFEYKRKKYSHRYGNSSYYYNDYYSGYYGNWNQPKKQPKSKWYVVAYEPDTHKYIDELVEASNDMEAVGTFLSMHEDLRYMDIADYYNADTLFDRTGTYGYGYEDY